jgi:curved DNA-binding protein CbpA
LFLRREFQRLIHSHAHRVNSKVQSVQPGDTLDYFALLGETRRPWLDPDVLKEKFLKLSAQVHPDRFHNQPESERTTAHQTYTDLNAAYQCLREPKDRLRHLLKLELGRSPENLQRVPPELMDFSMEIGHACIEVDRLLREKAATLSPLLKAQQFQRNQEWVDRLLKLRSRVDTLFDQFLAELNRIDSTWSSGTSTSDNQAALTQLDGLCRLFGFVGRWRNQLQERITQLSF